MTYQSLLTQRHPLNENYIIAKTLSAIPRRFQTPLPASRAQRRSLEDRIAAAWRAGERYTPSQAEWDSASEQQRARMTWPSSVLNRISREGW